LKRKAGEIGKGRGPAVIPTAFPAVWLRLQPRKFHAMPPGGFIFSDDCLVLKIHRMNLSDVDEASRLVNSVESAASLFRALLT
jgi:hypothetical protein